MAGAIPAFSSDVEADLRAGHFAKARAEAEELLASQQDNPNGWTWLGMACVHLNDPQRAITAFEHAIRLRQNDPRPYLNLALLYASRNELARAIEMYRKGLALDARNPGALFNYSRLLTVTGQLPEAREALESSIILAPSDGVARVELSRLCASLHDLRCAEKTAREALLLAPNELAANLALAEALIAQKRHADAEELLSKVEEHFGKSAPFQYTLGIARFGTRSYLPAIAAFERAVQLDPSLDLAHFLVGNAYLTVGRLDDAERSFQAAIRGNPRKPIYYNYLAIVYESKGAEFRAAAEDATREALALDSEDTDSRIRLAKWAKEDGDLPRARRMLENIVANDPKSVNARVLLSTIYYRLNLRSLGDEQRRIIRTLTAEEQEKATKTRQAPK